MATGKLQILDILAALRLLYVLYNIAPTADVSLAPDDVMEVLEELLPAQNKSFNLGLKFKLPLHEAEAIHGKAQSAQDYLRDVLVKFLKQVEPRPTWRVIVDALRSPAVDLPQLANRVEAAHFPDLTSTRDVVPETIPTGMTLSTICVVQVDMQSHAASVQAASPSQKCVANEREQEAADLPDSSSTPASDVGPETTGMAHLKLRID